MAQALLELGLEVLAITQAEAQLSVALFERYTPAGVSARDALHAAVM